MKKINFIPLLSSVFTSIFAVTAFATEPKSPRINIPGKYEVFPVEGGEKIEIDARAPKFEGSRATLVLPAIDSLYKVTLDENRSDFCMYSNVGAAKISADKLKIEIPIEFDFVLEDGRNSCVFKIDNGSSKSLFVDFFYDILD